MIIAGCPHCDDDYWLGDQEEGKPWGPGVFVKVTCEACGKPFHIELCRFTGRVLTEEELTDLGGVPIPKTWG